MSKKIYVIKGKDEDELAYNVNNFDKQIFATQWLQKIDGSFCAFVYVDESEFKIEVKPEELATDKQIFFLEKHEVAIPKGLTKSHAFNLIAEIKKSIKK